jgi:hypothetical protein
MIMCYTCYALFATIIFRKEKCETTKGVIRIRQSKDRQHNGQKKKDKRRNTTQKTKD